MLFAASLLYLLCQFFRCEVEFLCKLLISFIVLKRYIWSIALRFSVSLDSKVQVNRSFSLYSGQIISRCHPYQITSLRQPNQLNSYVFQTKLYPNVIETKFHLYVIRTKVYNFAIAEQIVTNVIRTKFHPYDTSKLICNPMLSGRNYISISSRSNFLTMSSRPNFILILSR